jgi:hypothetical protein
MSEITPCIKAPVRDLGFHAPNHLITRHKLAPLSNSCCCFGIHGWAWGSASMDGHGVWHPWMGMGFEISVLVAVTALNFVQISWSMTHNILEHVTVHPL